MTILLADKFRKAIPLLLRITGGLSILLGLLFLLISTEMFEHGAVFAFLGYISIILNGIGILSGLLILFRVRNQFAFVLLRCFSMIGLLFVLFYSIISNGFQEGMLFFLLFWSAILVFVSLSPVKAFVGSGKVQESGPLPHGSYLKLHGSLTLYVTALVVLFILVWVINWEAQAQIYAEPNAGGISNYVSETESPAVAVSIDGGFIYNVSRVISPDYQSDSYAFVPSSDQEYCGEIKIKLTSPSANIQIYPYETGILRLNIMNMSQDSFILLNGKSIPPEANISFSRWQDDSLIQLTTEQIVSGRHLTLSKGSVIDVQIESGIADLLQISPVVDHSSDKTFRFVVASDLHSGYNIFVPEIAKMLDLDPDFAIFNGDFTNLGYPAEYMVAAATTEILPFPVYTAIGNHDAWNSGSTTYNKYYGPFNYSFVYINTKFIFLDSSSGMIGQTQFDWLINELENNQSEHLFVISHMPPIDTVTGIFDTKNTLHPESLHTIHSKSESDYLLRLMKDYDVDVFFSGHTHIYGRIEIDGTTYITSGVLGGTVKPGNTVCYLLVEVSEKNYSIEMIDILSAEEASAKAVESNFQALRVFSVPFLINNSVRIALTLVIFIVFSLLWIPIRKHLLFIIKK